MAERQADRRQQADREVTATQQQPDPGESIDDRAREEAETCKRREDRRREQHRQEQKLECRHWIGQAA
jgi:hypothetical protein